MLNGVKIFDCTIREAGYQTGWYFDELFVRDLYKFNQGRGIDYMELGFFHNIEADPGRGIYRYCSSKVDEINKVFEPIKNYTKLSAMRDIQRPLSPLISKKNSVIDAIRIITRSHETNLDILERQVDEIRDFGYEVYINFTSSGYNTIEKNISFATFAKRIGLDTIYFADTESIFTPQYVIDTIKECEKIGIIAGMHLHDKNGMADLLFEIALANNVKYVDATLLGLGGKWHDGNLTTEHVLRRFGVNAGFEMTYLKTHLIQQLIKYNSFTTAVL